jgi:flagellin-specific chaperone FliS
MRKEELVAQLEAAKALTSVVSIDNVIALIQGLDPEVVTKTELRMTQTMFDEVSDVIESAINNMNNDDVVDLSSAEFEMDYHNTVRLLNVDVESDNIFDAIRDALDRCFEIVDDSDDSDEQYEGTLTE